MQPLIFQELDTMERIRTLESNADNIEEKFTYDKVLTEYEIAEEESGFAAVHIEIERLEAKKKDLVEQLSAEIKAKRKVADKSLLKIRTGREEVTETVYEIRDEVDEMIGVYNMHGVLISERPMRPNERQRRFNFSADSKVS